MELIFGFLPLPIAAVVIVATGILGFFIKKNSKSSAVKAITDTVVNTVVTKDRVDQTVEAVLAHLKVRHELADKIGDLIAEIVTEVLGTADSLSSKATIIASAVTSSDRVLPAVSRALVTRPTALNSVIVEVADIQVSQDAAKRAQVASAVVRAYARQAVL